MGPQLELAAEALSAEVGRGLFDMIAVDACREDPCLPPLLDRLEGTSLRSLLGRTNAVAVIKPVISSQASSAKSIFFLRSIPVPAVL